MTDPPDPLGSPEAGGAALRGGALRLAAYGGSVLLGLVYVPLLLRTLGVVDSGRYVLAVSIAAIAAGLTDGGLAAVGARELAHRSPAERERLLRGLLGLRIALSLLGVAAATAYALLAGLDTTLVLGTAVVGLATALAGVQTVGASVLSVDLRFGIVALAEITRQVVTTLGVVVLLVVGAGLLAFLANLAVAAVAALVLLVVLAGRTLPRRPAIDREVWAGLLRAASLYAVAAAIAVLTLRLGVLLVDRLSTPRELGLFGVSFRIVEALLVLPPLLVQAAFPILARAARDDEARLAYAIGRTATACALLGALLALVLLVGAPAIVDLLAPPDAAPAAAVLRIHALGLLASFVGATAGYGLLARGRTRAILASVVAGLTTAAVLGVLLVPGHGARGAAIAGACAELALTTTAWGLLLTGPAAVRPSLAQLPRIAVALGLGALPALVLGSALAAVAGVVVFTAAALALRAVPEELVTEARAFRRRAATSRRR